MADTNRVQLSFNEEETAWGTMSISATTPLIDLRFTGESFAFNISNIQSAEIRSDRQVTDLIQTGADVSGGYNFELSYDDNGFAELFKAALWSSGWTESIVSNRSSLQTIAGATYGWVHTLSYQELGAVGGVSTFVTGQWIKISGFSDTSAATYANNGCYFIIAARDTGLDVLPNFPGSTTSTDNTATLWVQGCMVRNGTTETSYTFERYHSDITQYFDFKGMVCNTLAITAAANAIVTGSFGFVGKTATLAATSGNTNTHTSAAENDVMNGVADVARIMEGYPSQTAGSNSFATIDSSLIIQEVSFNLANNVRGISGIGYLGYADVGVGAIQVTGNLNAYFLDNSFYDKYLAATETGLSFECTDNDGNTYIFTFPKIKIQTDGINVPGQNADVMENITWQAIRHPEFEWTIQVDKMAAGTWSNFTP